MNPAVKQFREQKRREKEIKEDLKRLAEIANDMLNDARYRRIKEMYDRAEANTIELLLGYKEADPIKYKMKITELVVKLGVYKNLLQIPKDLSKPNVKPNVNFVTKFLTAYKKDLETVVET